MSYVVVMPPWSKEESKEQTPPKPLSEREVDIALEVIRAVTGMLRQSWKAGADVDSRIRLMHEVARAVMNGQRIRVEILPKEEK